MYARIIGLCPFAKYHRLIYYGARLWAAAFSVWVETGYRVLLSCFGGQPVLSEMAQKTGALQFHLLQRTRSRVYFLFSSSHDGLSWLTGGPTGLFTIQFLQRAARAATMPNASCARGTIAPF